MLLMALTHTACSESPDSCVDEGNSVMAVLGLLGIRGSKPCCSFVVSKLFSPNSTPGVGINS